MNPEVSHKQTWTQSARDTPLVQTILFPALGLYKLAIYKRRAHGVLQSLFLKRMLLSMDPMARLSVRMPLPGGGDSMARKMLKGCYSCSVP